MKKLLTSGAVVLTMLTLAACGSNSSDSGKGVDNMKSSKKATESSSKKNSKASLEVTNGAPEKINQWKYFEDFDADGTLVKIAKPTTKIAQGKLSISINAIKIFAMKPKNTDAKKTAADYFGASGVTDPYYVLQVLWSVKNGDTKEIQTNGIKSLVVNGQQYDMGSGLMDDGTGSAIAAGASKSFEANTLLKSTNYKAIKQFTLNIDNSADTTSFEQIAPAVSTNLKL